MTNTFKAVVFVLIGLCMSLWLLAAVLVSCCILFFVLLLGPVWHRNHLVGEDRVVLFCFFPAFLSIAYVLSVRVCLLFLLESLVDYNL